MGEKDVGTRQPEEVSQATQGINTRFSKSKEYLVWVRKELDTITQLHPDLTANILNLEAVIIEHEVFVLSTQVLDVSPEATQQGTVTVKEAAEQLGLGTSAVVKAIHRDRIPARMAYGIWRIDAIGVGAYQRSVAHRRGKPGPKPKSN